MRWFWIIFIGAAVTVAGLLYFGFFLTFKANDWTTFGLSLAALLGTVYGMARKSTPKPHWSATAWEPVNLSTSSVAMYSALQVTIRQEGPGVAERVIFQYRDRETKKWGAAIHLARTSSTFDRHEAVTLHPGQVSGTVAAIKPGKYAVRISWRQEPNTVKPHQKVYRFKYDPKR